MVEQHGEVTGQLGLRHVLGPHHGGPVLGVDAHHPGAVGDVVAAARQLLPLVDADGHADHAARITVDDFRAKRKIAILVIVIIGAVRDQIGVAIADITIRRLLTLQGTMAPAQIISLMSYAGAPTAFAMTDHADHIHVGFRPLGGTSGAGVQAQGLRPKQWLRLVDRLGRIANPSVKRTLRRP